MGRRELREQIFKLLFQIEFYQAEDMPEQIRNYFDGLEPINEKSQAYIEEKYSKIIEKLTEIDAAIDGAAKGWKVSRMGKVDLTILRLAVYEMKYDEEVPVGVAINEAVEIAKSFGGDDSYSFVNAVLAKLA